ncbi:hypothetical protein P4O66_007765, partial [Electrophorus voltai]
MACLKGPVIGPRAHTPSPGRRSRAPASVQHKTLPATRYSYLEHELFRICG